jgi:hypothetical protein
MFSSGRMQGNQAVEWNIHEPSLQAHSRSSVGDCSFRDFSLEAHIQLSDAVSSRLDITSLHRLSGHTGFKFEKPTFKF